MYIQLVTFLVIASVLLQWWIVFGNPGVIEPRTLHPEADRTMVSQEQIRALKNVRKGLPEDHDPSKPKPRKLQFRQEDVSGKSVSKVVATSKASGFSLSLSYLYDFACLLLLLLLSSRFRPS